jgi:hypothetical protein
MTSRAIAIAAVHTGAALLAASAAARAQVPGLDFGTATNFDLDKPQPISMCCADFDLDGDLDLATADRGDHADAKFNVLLNDGTGDFSDGHAYFCVPYAWGIATGDVDGDQVPDLAVSDGENAATSVQVWRGNGDGTFSLMQSVTSGRFPLAMVIADLDGDGWHDMAVANNVSYGLTIFRNDGNGTLGAAQHVPGLAGTMSTDLAGADIDGDGDVDLALGHQGGVRLLRNDGLGAFTSSQSLGAYMNGGVSLGDLDQDGDADLASLGAYTNLVYLYWNDGSGSFAASGTLATLSTPGTIVVADLNRDGLADLHVTRQWSTVSAWRGLGGGAFGPRQDFATGFQATCATHGDLDGDLLVDLAVAFNDGGDQPGVSILLQRWPLPIAYCTAKVNSLDCTPAISASGTPSMTSPAPFTISASNVLSQKFGLCFYGYGFASAPFQGGTMCVQTPLRRTPIQSSGGSAGDEDCSGTFAFDFNAHAQSGADPALDAGVWTYAEYWYRDPASASTTGLSDALAFLIRP